MEEITFIHDESARYLLILLGSLVWLTALSLASRISRLPPRPRALVNLLSLATGPVGWSVHAYSWYQGRQTPPADAGSESLPPSLAPRPVEEAVATKTAVALATIAAPAAASQRKFRISAFVSRLFGKKSQIHNDSEIFNAGLILQRQEATTANLRRVLLRFPAMTLKTIGGIYWQALRLWLKGTPFHDHPAQHEVQPHGINHSQ